MQSKIYVDPKLDLYSEDYVELLIEFKIKPAKVAIGISDIRFEQAQQQVELSHHLFRQELNDLDVNKVKHFISHTYKNAFNGVSMRLRGNTIKHLLESTVIKAIYKNQQASLPKKPSDTMYQI